MEKQKITHTEAENIFNLLLTTTNITLIKEAALVIETICENQDEKEIF